MARDIKYGHVTTERGNIGEGEPVFIIRANDIHALSVLDYYRNLCSAHNAGKDHLDAIGQNWEVFSSYQRDNGDKVKRPDTNPDQIEE
jgi:hypothetical protein